MARKIQGFVIQLLNKNTGEAVDRQWFKRLADGNRWLHETYPDWQEKYDIEIFCD